MSLKRAILLNVSIFIFIFSLKAQSSNKLSIQFNYGIENPYNYRPSNNASPFFGGFGIKQPFRFFRTKITGVGVVYSYNLPILKERVSVRGGINVNYMNQYIADTLISPKMDQFLYAIKHRNIHLMTEIGTSIRIYKALHFTAGLELFSPIVKWINSEQDDFLFKSEYSERFYSGNLYSSIGIELEFDRFSIGTKYQNSGETDHWVYESIVKAFVDYKLQRWIINIRYNL